eukprot:10876877-Karenia_brevis.AAC.1
MSLVKSSNPTCADPYGSASVRAVLDFGGAAGPKFVGSDISVGGRDSDTEGSDSGSDSGVAMECAVHGFADSIHARASAGGRPSWKQ